MVQQIVKARAPFGVHFHDFTVQYHRPAQLTQGACEGSEASIDVALSGDQQAAAVINIDDAAKSVLLQLKDEFWVIERGPEKCWDCWRKVLLVQLTLIVAKQLGWANSGNQMNIGGLLYAKLARATRIGWRGLNSHMAMRTDFSTLLIVFSLIC